MVITLPTRQYMYFAINLFALFSLSSLCYIHSYHWEQEIALTIAGKDIIKEKKQSTVT